MSNFLYAVNLQNKTYCFLGKGSGWLFLKEAFEKGYGNSIDDFVYWVANEVFGHNSLLHGDQFEHIKNIYESIAGLPLNKLTVISDSEDDLFIMKCLGYKCVHSLFTNDCENLHLTTNKHRYVLSSSAALEYDDFIKFYQ